MTDNTEPVEREFAYLSEITQFDFLDYMAEMAKELESLCAEQGFDKLSTIFHLAHSEATDVRKLLLRESDVYRQSYGNPGG